MKPLYKHYFFRPSATVLPLATALVIAATAEAATESATESQTIEQVEVSGQYLNLRYGTGDTSDLLKEQGVNFSSAGGISSLPVIRGLNDDRIKLIVDGAETTSACANHMNPALSYIDASRVQAVEVIAGITPVSSGGDSIGGTIIIESEQPRYASNSEELLTSGAVAYFYHSNNHNHGAALNATIASEQMSLTYSGSVDQAESYHDGNDNKVLDTLYRSDNQNLTLGLRGDRQSLIVKLTHQEVPYQGFPNQYMDMVGNISNGINVQYLREFDWGQLDTRITWQDVDHEMGFFTEEKTGTMPMITEGKDIGYKIGAQLPLSNDSTLRLGHEFHRFTLDDWWPAVDGHMAMSPNDYININNGERTRYAFYLESENNLSQYWQTLAGVRYERVVMDTDDVQPYNTMPTIMSMLNLDPAAATEFNSRDHRRTDDNFDLTAVARYLASSNQSLEFGYGRKTRSPNLYERYSWGLNTMSVMMVGWFGDGNGYVGNIDLDPEIAHTLSSTWKWHNDNETRELSATPYYTYVDDFIDAEQIGTFHPKMAMAVTRPKLQFINLDAELYGIELRGRINLLDNNSGKLNLRSNLEYTQGERRDDHSDLYHIMPLNIDLALEHRINSWTTTLEVEWVANKDHVDDMRMENATDSFTLVNISTLYQWRKVSISAGIRNLFDRNYDLPLGGAYLSGWIASDRTEQFESLAGEGRSFDLGLQYQF